MKNLIYLFSGLMLLVFSSVTSFAQSNFFEVASSRDLLEPVDIAKNLKVKQVLRLDEQGLRSYLQNAPMEFQRSKSTLLLDIPLPNGKFETFTIFESPILSPEVAAQHPEIKTYTGNGTINKEAILRLSLTSEGFDAILLNVEGDAVYFQKYSSQSKDVYFNYFTKDVVVPQNKSRAKTCGIDLMRDDSNQQGTFPNLSPELKMMGVPVTLKTYRLAMAANGEFTAQNGGTQASSFAAVVGYVNRMTAIYRRDLSVTFTLVSGLNLIYTNSATDPYDNNDQIAMLDENHDNCNLVIGSSNYDVGHVWGYVGGSGGGVASSPSVCNVNFKGSGVSGEGDLGSYAQVFMDQLLFHEVGHQFGMSHSYNSSIPVCTTRNPGTSVEPGSGATIMSYGFTCDTDDYFTTGSPQTGPILQFHAANLAQANAYTSAGGNCFTSSATGNTTPDVTVPGGYIIPHSTPFALTGSATDVDNDILTYNWEGMNIGVITPDVNTLTDLTQPPFFRTYGIPDSSSATRTYPLLSAILNGSNYSKGDKLPSVGVVTTHRLTVRDNNAAGGGVTFANVTVTVNGAIGPFLETTNLNASYVGLSSQNITWSVNGTDAATPNVRITLSTDGGQTFPITLMASTPNDGNENVTLPNIATATARIKVEAVGNIFFDISNSNFTITESASCPPTGTTWYVDVAAAGGGNGASWTCAFQQIQTAINTAAAGDVILVAAGTYTENLLVDKSLTLTGAGRDLTFVNAAAAGYTLHVDGNVGIPVLAGDVIIEGFTFADPQRLHWTIVATDHIATGLQLTFRNNRVTDGNRYGLWDYHSHGTLLCENNIFSDVYYGVFLEGWASEPVTIQNNEFTDLHFYIDPMGVPVPSFGGPVGVLAMTYSAGEGENCTNPYRIFENNFHTYFNDGFGIVFNGGLTGQGSARYTDVEISRNTISTGLTGTGIRLRNLPAPNNSPDGGVHDAGIYNNIITNVQYGIRLQGENPGTEAHDNSLVNCSTLAIENTGTAIMDASCNWYGIATPAGVAAKIAGNVDYQFWLVNGTDNVPGTTGFQPAPGTCTGCAQPALQTTINSVIVTSNNNGIDDTGSFSVCNAEDIDFENFQDISGLGLSGLKVFQTVSYTNVNPSFCNNCAALLSIYPGTSETANLTNPVLSGTIVLRFRAWSDDNSNNMIDAEECTGDWIQYTITVLPTQLYYVDTDNDGFGIGSGVLFCSNPGIGYAAVNGDCDDNDPIEKPGQIWYKDTDNDNYAETGAASIVQCLRPAGYRAAVELTSITGDCDDNNPAINAGITEVCGNSIDDDCDGQTDEDCCDLIVSNVSSTPPACPGGNNGTITIAASTSSGPITYNISGPVNQNNQTGLFTGLPSGNYSYFVSDAASCNQSSSVAVADGVDAIPPVVMCSNHTVNFNGETSIPLNSNDLVSASDNCGVQSIVLSPNSISSNQVNQTVPVLVTVTDVNGNSSSCTSQVMVSGLPPGWSQNVNGVGCNEGSNIQYNSTTGIWTATSTDCYYSSPFTSDETAFAQRTLCGNGSITAQVTNISGTSLGWAGIVMRESNAPGAKKVQLMTNLSNLLRREVRSVTNGPAQPQQIPAQNRYWLRIVRTGNQFVAYSSPNGNDWFQVLVVNVPMNSCIEMGLVVTNYNQNSTVTATFANVSYTGNGPVTSSSIPENGVITSFEQYQPDFSLYPNPTSGELNIGMKEYLGKKVQIELYSLEGKLMQLIQMDEVLQSTQTLLLDKYASGMYFVKLKSAGLPDVTKRIVLNKG